MLKLAALLPLTFLAVLVTAVHSQSLADLAKMEKERRQEIKNGIKVITNAEAAKYTSGPVTTFSVSAKPAHRSESEGEDRKAEKEAQASKADPDEPVDFQGRPESYWRKTMAEARQKVRDLENEANVLSLKQNDLQMQFYREDDGFKREGIQREIQKTLYEQDRNKENLAKAKDMLADLEKEARKSGALPGWIE